MVDVVRSFCHIKGVMSKGLEPSRYRDKRTTRFAEGERVREFQSSEQQIKKRLVILEEAALRKDLALLPSNRFEALGGDRKGQYSIRINWQWRICFEWPDDHTKPFNIEIVDYH
jgi:proteic killer suppression protein